MMVNCHEAPVPSGIERTWPNFATREYNHSLADGKKISSPVDHTVTPLLNNVVGPIDVTPGFFDLDRLVERDYVRAELKTTVVAQAAMALTYFSPILTLARYSLKPIKERKTCLNLFKVCHWYMTKQGS